MTTSILCARLPVAALAAAGLGLLLSGCAGTAEPTAQDLTPEFIVQKSEQFRSEGRTALADAFADGVVDANEYADAFTVFSRCFTGRGHVVSDPVLNPADNLRFIYELDSVGFDPEVVAADQNECSADFLEVEAMYTATTPQKMDEPLRLAIIDCMQAQSLPIDPAATSYPEFVQSAGDDATEPWRRVFGSCLSEAGAKLFPDLSYIPVGY